MKREARYNWYRTFQMIGGTHVYQVNYLDGNISFYFNDGVPDYCIFPRTVAIFKIKQLNP